MCWLLANLSYFRELLRSVSLAHYALRRTEAFAGHGHRQMVHAGAGRQKRGLRNLHRRSLILS